MALLLMMRSWVVSSLAVTQQTQSRDAPTIAKIELVVLDSYTSIKRVMWLNFVRP